MHTVALDAIRRQKQEPLPTPPVGFANVVWIDRNDPKLKYPARVTQVEGPGKLKLIVWKPNHHAIHKQGVLHTSHPTHMTRANPLTVRNGSWDYVEGQSVPKRHYELHLRELERREEAMLEEERSKRSQAEQKKAIGAEFETQLVEKK